MKSRNNKRHKFPVMESLECRKRRAGRHSKQQMLEQQGNREAREQITRIQECRS